MESAVPFKSTKSKLSTLETLPVEIIQHVMYQVDINTLRKLILVSSRLYNVYMGATEVILYHVTANEVGSWEVFGAALARYASSKPDLNPGIDNFLIENPGHDLAAKFKAGDDIYKMDMSGFRMPKSYFTPSMVMEILGFHELVEDVVARFEDVVDDALIEGYDLDEYEPRTYYTPLERLQMKTGMYMAEILSLLLPGKFNRTTNEMPALYFNGEGFARVHLQRRMIQEPGSEHPLFAPYSMVQAFGTHSRHTIRQLMI